MTPLTLADTGPLYALADPSDQYHSRANLELAALGRRRLAIAIHYATLCEAYTLMLCRLGGKYARQWLGEMFDSAVLLSPEPADYATAAGFLERFDDHAITLVDAVTAALAIRLEIPVWAFDSHFVLMRTRQRR